MLCVYNRTSIKINQQEKRKNATALIPMVQSRFDPIGQTIVEEIGSHHSPAELWWSAARPVNIVSVMMIDASYKKDFIYRRGLRLVSSNLVQWHLLNRWLAVWNSAYRFLHVKNMKKARWSLIIYITVTYIGLFIKVDELPSYLELIGVWEKSFWEYRTREIADIFRYIP